MKKFLIQKASPEDKKKQALREQIEKKTKLLEELMEKVETLRIELEFIQHEYNVRIGALLLKDNQLDLEILQLKNLKELMKGGMTYSAAMKYEEDAFYSEILRMQKEQEKIAKEKKILDDIQDVSEEVKESIREIWKKLIRQFHPDLVTDREEKAKREEIMKKINKAYAENNLEALQAYESTRDVESLNEFTLLQLEEMLDKVEESLHNTQGEWNILQKSIWLEWKKKRDQRPTHDKKFDVFAELEQKFLDDIVKKIEIAQVLRKEVHP